MDSLLKPAVSVQPVLKWCVERFNFADLKQVISLYNRSRALVPCFTRAKVTQEQFLGEMVGEDLWVVKLEEQVVGFVSVWAPDRFIHHLYVLPDYQSNGIAQALITHCAAHYGFPLSLNCLAANLKACQFYQAKGWVLDHQAYNANGIYHHYQLHSNMAQSCA